MSFTNRSILAFYLKLKSARETADQLEREIERLKHELAETGERCGELTSALERQSALEQVQTSRTAKLEADLLIEKKWRMQLQQENADKTESVRVLGEKCARLDELEREHDRLQGELFRLSNENGDLERTLEEMGSKLGVSQLKMDGFKEASKQLNGFQWEQDENVTICKLCNKDFNVARRKHHCRRCGGIFCNECSDNKMPLPSSSKPVRVCNPCCDSIVQSCVASK